MKQAQNIGAPLVCVCVPLVSNPGIIKEESSRRNHGGVIKQESSRRNHQGGIIKEESSRRNHQGGIIKEESSRRNGGVIKRES